MFGSGRGHAEYKGFSKIHELKALETVTYATTRFSSSAFEQWEKIYKSYPGLIQAYIKNREDQDDECEETKYQVRGQDYAIDLCGIIDILKPAVTLMTKGRQHFIKDRRRAETTNGGRSIHPRRTIVTKDGQALGRVD
jgi:hypothetical protein